MYCQVHNCYGDELGLTSDDEDYIDPYENKDDETQQFSNNINNNKSAESVSEDHSEAQSDAVLSSSKHTSDEKGKIKVVSKPEPKINHRKMQNKNNRKRDNDTAMTTSEQLPTDMSDSSDSESCNNVPFVSTAECNSMHEGRQLVHTILPINVDTLLSLLFSKSKFLVDFHAIRKTTNMVHEDWAINEDGLKFRKVMLTVALTQAVGPKCSHVSLVKNFTIFTV